MATNLADLLAAAARAEPGRIALSEAESGRNITWSELDDLAARAAAGFARAGMVAGYRIAFVADNSIEFVAAYFGALRSRLVVVPTNPRGTTGELIRVLADSGSRMVVVDTSAVDVVRAAADGMGEALAAGSGGPGPRLVTVGVDRRDGQTTWDDLVAEPGEVVPGETDPENLAVLLYTSGTSGSPRAAMLSHRALLANIDQAAAIDPPLITGRDVVLGVLPLFHVYGLNAVLGQVVRQHSRLVLVNGFDAEGSLDLIEDEAVSVVPVAPPVFAYWMQVPGLEERLGPVRRILSGSAPISPDLVEDFTRRTGLAIHQGYGLTEAAPVVTSSRYDEDELPDPRGVGMPLPGIELRIRDDGADDTETTDGGEILVRGDNLFSGYWPDGADGPDDEGWWATGDVGYLDGDGQLFLVDRLREIVIVSGFNVYPTEVEDVLTELADVATAAVIGVEDEATGEAVVAYLVPAREVAADALVEHVRTHCAERLARFKQPSRFHVVDELPRTVTGKVQKGRLRAAERRRALGLLE